MKASKKQRAAAVERVRQWRASHRWSYEQQWKRSNAKRAKKGRRPAGVEERLETNEAKRSGIETGEGTGWVTGIGERSVEYGVPVIHDRGAEYGSTGSVTGPSREERRVASRLAELIAGQAEATRVRPGVRVELIL
jgi:hypothetical protein